MTDFTYTDASTKSSTAVKSAYYNSDDKTLLVVMRENGNAYRYDGVPSWVWTDFKASSSVGRYFSTKIKPSYGPSKFVGIGKNLRIEAKNTVASVTSLPNARYSLGTPPVAPGRRAAVGTPKGLTVAPNATVTNGQIAANKLAAPVLPLVKSSTVKFATEIGEKSVTFDDKYTVEAAHAEVFKIADMLGLEIEVKSVTVNFE